MHSRFGDVTFQPSTPVSQRKGFTEQRNPEVVNNGNPPSLELANVKTPNSKLLPQTPRKTPRSNCKTPNSRTKTPSRHTPSGDRFIPSRFNIDFDAAHFKLVNEGPKDSISPTKLEAERQFKENLDPGSSDPKILSFKLKKPASQRGNFADDLSCDLFAPNLYDVHPT